MFFMTILKCLFWDCVCSVIQQVFRVPSHVPGAVLYIVDVRENKT